MASDRTIAAEGTAPAITLFLRNMSVAEEQTISFVCKASGSPMPKFTWYRDNKRIKAVNRQRYEIKPMPHGSVLRIEPVKARRDSGKFTCEAENDYGDKVQTSAFLHVYPVDQKDIPQGYPRITVNPKLKSIEKGRNAIMKCEAEAPGIYNQEPIQIEWFKDKIPVDLTDPRLTKVDPGYLQIHNSMESDHGRYECVASNSKGVAYSFAAMLYVKVRRVPPHFTMPPKNVEINPYTNVNLTCVAVGSPMPKVKFRAGPIELTPEDEEHIGTNTLVLINITESKNYTCVASSELGNIEHVVQVKVKETMNYSCNLNLNIEHVVQVKVKGKAIVTETMNYTYVASSELGNIEHVVQVKVKGKAIVTESKNYTCVASSDLGNIEHVVQVKVKGKAIVTETMNYTYVASSELGNIEHIVQVKVKGSDAKVRTLSIQCIPNNLDGQVKRLKGIPEVKGQGQTCEREFDSMIIIGLDKIFVKFLLFPPSFVQIMKFHRTFLAFYSLLTLLATGNLAEIPNPPVNFNVVDVGPGFVKLSWTPVPGDKIDYYKLQYRQKGDISSIFSEERMRVPAHKVRRLTPFTDYEFKVIAVNSVGESRPTDILEKRTSSLAPGTPPKNVRAVALSPLTVLVKWDEPAKPNGIIKGYKIFYTLEPDLPITLWTTLDVPLPQANQRQATITELKPNKTYSLCVLAYSTLGEGPISDLEQVMTKPGVPGQPRNLHANEKGPNKIEVIWSPPDDYRHIQSYILYYNDSTARQAAHVVIQPPTNNYLLEELIPDTIYHIQVSATSLTGEGPKSTIIQMKTPQFVPSAAPQAVTGQPVSKNSIKVTWKPPPVEKHNGEIEGYRIYFRKNDSDLTDEDATAVKVGKDARMLMLGELNIWTDYKIWVLSFTTVGDGPPSPHVIVRTQEDVPGEPKSVKVDVVNSTTLFVEWKPPVSRRRNGIIRGYYVYFIPLDDNDNPKGQEKYYDTKDGSIVEAVITELDPNTFYRITVAGYTRKGDGERSEERKIKTSGPVPSDPRNFDVELVNAENPSVSMSWQKPLHVPGTLKHFRVSWGRKGDLIYSKVLSYSRYSFATDKLDKGATYEFRVQAVNENGVGHRAVKTLDIPDGVPPAPQHVVVSRTSWKTIQVTWDEPKVPVSGYRVSYNQFDVENLESWPSIDIGPYTVAEITGLEKQSYAIRVSAKSLDGRFGNASAAVLANVPTRPERDDIVTNFRVTLRTSTTINLAWDPPKQIGINNYLLEIVGMKFQRLKGQISPQNLSPIQPINIPGARYMFNITSLFRNGKRGPEQYLMAETRLEAPREVKRPEIEKIEKGNIKFSLTAASEVNGGISHYYLIVVPILNSTVLRRPQDYQFEELFDDPLPPTYSASKPYIAAKFSANRLPSLFTLGDGDEYEGFINRPLNKDWRYRVFLRAHTVEQDLYTTSDYSAPITLGPYIRQSPRPIAPSPGDTDTVDQASPNVPNSKSLMIIMIVAPVCAGVALIIIGCILLVWYMRRKSHRKSKTPEPLPGKVFVDVPPHPSDPVELRRQHYQTPGMISHPPIPVHMLADHIDNLKASDNMRFSQEYESIEPGQQFTWDNSNYEINKPKNRYANVIAYDHSRVILQPIDGIPGSDYINANYMDGYRKQNAYIATQGPLPETFGDFWRGVWEQRSNTIVMMTKLEERSRIKCDQYWPHRGGETYGIMQVLLVDVTELSTYTIRTFHVSRYGYPEKREVRQFQFTAWPDHGVPDHPTPLLMFMKRVKACNPPDAGPMIVHCSAGVGRTGAFIVIDAMLERVKHEKTVDIYGHVTCLRAQRNYMVQTEDQYIFIHDALLEAVTCGNTEIPARNLSAHIQKLLQPEPGETSTGMELEFKRLANMKASPNRFISANLPVNKFKNRLVNILPYESTRVSLHPIRGVDGSDYINASFIDGYRYRQAYVATQGPLAETAEDFWRMLWEHNSTIIVMLTKLREMGREKCHQYWPSERSARYQYFVVDPMAEYDMPSYMLREFKVTDARDGQSRTIRQFQFTDWPEQGVPKSGEGFIDFIGQVHKTKEQFGQEGPICVHCSAGVGRTGVFITLSIVLERMRYEGVVDMFQTVKMLRTQRPAMVQTEDQYQFCYRAALEYLGSFDHYAT
ncbi:PTPRD [Mytilus coruscus]|uniref:protein-tyrosine-phosphatase n=1 Tax=Mytilus coruscus TaxID=42192 RepID=A0A6J8ARI0_MYTCO|nr:PTPRD [Mytilus coruscus]